MRKKHLAENLKNIRKIKGFSQEALAVSSNLSLRTIQRLEAGETEPTAHTLRRIAVALNVNSDQLTNEVIETDSNYIKTLNTSALTFLLFPLLGIVAPFILWNAKKDKPRSIDKAAKSIINFQITWNTILFTGFLFGLFIVSYKTETTGVMSMDHFRIRNQFYLYFISIMYFFNLLMIIANRLNLQRNRGLFFRPKINFIGK